jgi:hypothetical protein
MKQFIFFIFLFSILTPLPANLSAEVILDNKFEKQILNECKEKICVPEKVSFSATTLQLRGHELFKYYFFKIYVASFYSENPISNFSDLFEVKGDKYLKLQYLRSINREDFIKSSEDAFNHNPNVNQELIRKELEMLYSSYEDIAKGETYALYFTQESNTTCLFKNNVQKVCIEGEAFAKAYFGIWLSEYSLNNEFSKRLLGKN